MARTFWLVATLSLVLGLAACGGSGVSAPDAGGADPGGQDTVPVDLVPADAVETADDRVDVPSDDADIADVADVADVPSDAAGDADVADVSADVPSDDADDADVADAPAADADDADVADAPAADVPSDDADDADVADAPADVPDVPPLPGLSDRWTVQVAEASKGYKGRVAVAVGADGTAHLAYNVATSADGWLTPSIVYAAGKGGEWTGIEAVPAAGISKEFPAIALGADGLPRIFYNRYDATAGFIHVMMVAIDAAGKASDPVVLTAGLGKDAWAPSVRTGPDGAFHVVFEMAWGDPEARQYGIGYLKVDGAAATVPETVATATSPWGLDPDYGVAVDADGAAHVVYCRPGSLGLNTVLYYRARAADGTWGDEVRLSASTQDVWSPAVAVDGAKVVHVAYGRSPNWDYKTLYYQRLQAGASLGETVVSSYDQDRSYYLGLAAEADGTVHVAFRRMVDDGTGSLNGDVFYLKGKDGVFGDAERVTASPAGDEGATAIALDASGVPHLAFVEDLSDAPNGTVFLAIRAP